MTDANEAVVNRYAYDSFGRVQKSETVRNAYAFTGREYDGETGLYYYRARYYDPEAGRFVSKDPIGFAGGDVNLYGYVSQNPVNWVDPWGLEIFNPNHYSVSLDLFAVLVKFNDYIGSDKDIVITSGTRSASSNLGAGSNSTHVRGIAADIVVPGQPHLMTANQADQSRLFGGIGWYEEGYRGPRGEGPHVHVDLRGGKAMWGFSSTGEEYHGYFPNYGGDCK